MVSLWPPRQEQNLLPSLCLLSLSSGERRVRPSCIGSGSSTLTGAVEANEELLETWSERNCVAGQNMTGTLSVSPSCKPVCVG